MVAHELGPLPDPVPGEDTATPTRVQLSRAKGWRMPPGTVKVDRSTKWGNPFIVGRHGTQAECVDLFNKLAHGYICISKGTDLAKSQTKFLKTLVQDFAELRGKNLACWCRTGAPCHADVLLRLVNVRHKREAPDDQT